jgi:hypothetical protein
MPPAAISVAIAAISVDDCSRGEPMPVLGVGGLFFRARDPDLLTALDREHLGVWAGCAAAGTGAPEQWSWKVQPAPAQ